jgi:hypothetical protein
MNWTTQKYDDSHGSPYDRGQADSYYGRPRNPHYYTGRSILPGPYPQTYGMTRVEEKDMSPEELEAYTAGFDYNEWLGDKKDWG